MKHEGNEQNHARVWLTRAGVGAGFVLAGMVLSPTHAIADEATPPTADASATPDHQQSASGTPEAPGPVVAGEGTDSQPTVSEPASEEKGRGRSNREGKKAENNSSGNSAPVTQLVDLAPPVLTPVSATPEAPARRQNEAPAAEERPSDASATPLPVSNNPEPAAPPVTDSPALPVINREQRRNEAPGREHTESHGKKNEDNRPPIALPDLPAPKAPAPPAPETPAGPEKVGGVIYYNQHDQPWAETRYDGGSGTGNIDNNGCGPSTLAMAVSTLSGQTVTPIDMANRLMQLGLDVGVTYNGSTYHGAMVQIAQEHGLPAEFLPNEDDLAAIDQITEQGGLVITNGTDSDPVTPATSGGHIIGIRDVEDGMIYLYDSNSRENSNKPFSPEQIFGPSSIGYAIHLPEGASAPAPAPPAPEPAPAPPPPPSAPTASIVLEDLAAPHLGSSAQAGIELTDLAAPVLPAPHSAEVAEDPPSPSPAPEQPQTETLPEIKVFMPVLDVIADGESNGNYNAYYGNVSNDEIIFTNMSVEQVLSWQAHYVNEGSPSSAVGRYQFIQDTLAGLLKELQIDPGTKFDAQLQDRLGVALLKRRGADEYIGGQISRDEFVYRLSQEWASLPTGVGPNPESSYYDGDGLNSAHVTITQIHEAVSRIPT